MPRVCFPFSFAFASGIGEFRALRLASAGSRSLGYYFEVFGAFSLFQLVLIACASQGFDSLGRWLVLISFAFQVLGRRG